MKFHYEFVDRPHYRDGVRVWDELEFEVITDDYHGWQSFIEPVHDAGAENECLMEWWVPISGTVQ